MQYSRGEGAKDGYPICLELFSKKYHAATSRQGAETIDHGNERAADDGTDCQRGRPFGVAGKIEAVDASTMGGLFAAGAP